MNRKNLFVFPIFLGTFFVLSAQETEIYTHENKAYQDALALYNNQQYQAAQSIFQTVKASTKDGETEANSAYYAANAAIRLNQRGADKMMEDFVERYPTSTKRNSAFLDVADYYFETGKYPFALKWYKKVDESSMSYADKERFNFNNGYALYASNRPSEAERYLSKVTTSQKYGSQAKYYLGYIAYEQDDYNQASARFDQITDPELLNEKLSYYQADLNFKLGKFEEAIAMAEKQLPKSDRQEVSELNKIIGESYFNLEQYGKAIPYLEGYKGKRGKFNNTDYYLLGYSHYKQGDYQNAIQQFNKIIGGSNNVSQNAYYHLAECYLKLDKKSEALNAFRNASQMDFSPGIQKDAMLNYARLSYEIGNAYEPVPQVLTNYLEKYPKDENQMEIQELLVDSYITSRNFEGAMQLLEKNKNYASKETYQKVAYYRGVELFIDGDYEAALESFSKSLKSAENATFEARTLYWKAESAYRLNRFEEALVDFVKFQQLPASKALPEYEELDYNLGYCYFKLKDYNNAIAYFKNVVNSNAIDEDRKNDGYLRLGDSYFVTSKYQLAMNAYDASSKLNGPERDYAAFQKTLSNGFLGNNSAKIDGLNEFLERYPNSSLRDDALFELGNSYIKDNQENLGLRTYDRLVAEYAKSKFAPQGMLRQGLVHYNASRNQQALDKLKEVVQKYPNTQEAKQAVATAKLVYVDEGRVSEYAAWARNLDFVEVTDSELDNASFESAEKKQMEGKTDVAIKGYEDYLKQFPNGLHSGSANFALAQLYFAKGQKDKALPRYKAVADGGNGEYTEQALTRVCEIYVEKQDYQSAIPYLKRLESTADISENRTFAQSNLMKGYYGQKDYGQTIAYAEKVLKAPKIDDRIKSDAQIMIARSAIATENEALAKTAYQDVKKIATGELAAEAWYYDAYFKNKEGNFEASNTAVQKLAKDYSAYKTWAGKGLVIMAKNFYNLGDAFQATYILESVISNFSDYDEIVTEAKSELAIIKTKEAESNSSVDPNEN
ncbi:outer membrane protein assembly factor BamD [Flagellimonas taeanensis]|uniref:tetratricopeptide repeat protein n=1 Tax=Flavobacteriaceae TaxID=49546 RepID=UPI000E67D97B|nr:MULTISPECIES: tetratricopeptide repeat protein [Allomuricauda]MDC6386428.1 tetratricopeptide repeat protein [Muricauda sp. SK9]RIV52013.1 outer membrane protein assembly factor BamD [Allomuricauda taeanensis]